MKYQSASTRKPPGEGAVSQIILLLFPLFFCSTCELTVPVLQPIKMGKLPRFLSCFVSRIHMLNISLQCCYQKPFTSSIDLEFPIDIVYTARSIQ
jgi:hypothetical protein